MAGTCFVPWVVIITVLYFLRRSLRHHVAARVILTAFLAVAVLGLSAHLTYVRVAADYHDRAYEIEFKEDLRSLRAVIDDFYAVKKRYPADLGELNGYLKGKGNDRGFETHTEGAVIEYSLLPDNSYAVRAYRTGGNRVYLLSSASRTIRYRMKREKDDAFRDVQ